MFLDSMFKDIILSNFNLYSLFLQFSLHKSSLLFDLKASKLNTRSLLTQRDLVEAVTHSKLKSSGVCHIIGSGWSLLNSLYKVSPNDYVIGFNYSGMCDLSFDLYIAEFGGYSVSNASFDHLKIATQLSKTDNNTLILFKNIWQDKNEIPFLNKYWVGNASFVRDRIYPLPRKQHLSRVLNMMLNDTSRFFPQCVSTVIFSIILAYKAGFTSVVLHGVDFGGQYFYESDHFSPAINVSPSNTSQSGVYGFQSATSRHPTSLGRVTLQDLILTLSEIFLANARSLSCGSSLSPSSRLLPVYKSSFD